MPKHKYSTKLQTGSKYPIALHINSYFLSNSIHFNFYKKIREKKEDKFILPVYKHFKNQDIKGVDIDYILRPYDSKLFFTKAIKVLYLVCRKKIFKGYDYIHAHTLFSDGFAAYILAVIFRKKLVVSVRDTDVRVFLPASKIFKWLGNIILKRASMVFFISPSIKKAIQEKFPNICIEKFAYLPNGVDDFWIENRDDIKRSDLKKKETIKLLFVGQIIPRKNLQILIDFISHYQDKRYILQIVGKNFLGVDFESINSSLTNGNRISYLGEVHSKEELLKIYRDSDLFILLSHAETFGVVYIEAISQNVPVIYSENQGIDGYFDEGYIGYASSTNSLTEIKEKIDLVITNSETIHENSESAIKYFRWDNVIQGYLNNIQKI